jgi:hypothetical protein
VGLIFLEPRTAPLSGEEHTRFSANAMSPVKVFGRLSKCGRSKKTVCRAWRAKISAILDLTGCCGTLDLWSATAAAIKAPIRLFGVHLYDAEQKLWHHAFLKLGIDQSVLRACVKKSLNNSVTFLLESF